MIHLARWSFTILFAWQMWRACHPNDGGAFGDVTNAGNFGLAIIVGMAAGVMWAPVIGDAVARPITAPLTDGVPSQAAGRLLRVIRRCELRGWRRMALGLCFLEGVRHPDLPAAFLIGLRNTRPGTWTEKSFAREVFRFNNVANCIRAREILVLRHDYDPGLHAQPEVNLALLAQRREERPPSPPVALPLNTARPILMRNPRIKIFEKAVRGTTANEAASEKAV